MMGLMSAASIAAWDLGTRYVCFRAAPRLRLNIEVRRGHETNVPPLRQCVIVVRRGSYAGHVISAATRRSLPNLAAAVPAIQRRGEAETKVQTAVESSLVRAAL